MKAMEGRIRSDIGSDMKAMEGRIRSDIGSDMKAMEGRIRSDIGSDMKAMEGRIIHEIGAAASHVANVMMEQIRGLVSVVDEKYQDLPARDIKLRADFDSHATDLRLHTRPPAAPLKRTRRPRSR